MDGEWSGHLNRLCPLEYEETAAANEALYMGRNSISAQLIKAERERDGDAFNGPNWLNLIKKKISIGFIR